MYVCHWQKGTFCQRHTCFDPFFVSDSESLLRWTQFCLLLLPEVTTFWNIRKKMIQKMLLKPDIDLRLSKLVLTRKPKCIEAFQHRRWLFTLLSASSDEDDNPWRNDLAFNNNIREAENITTFLLKELDLCTWTADRKPNNYHSWNHRIWVIEKLSLFGNIEELYRNEYQSSQEWISFHVSEHSGLHYRSKILDFISMACERGNINLGFIHPNLISVKDLYLKELKLNNDLLHVYPEHESLFYHRRAILTKLQNTYRNNQRASSPPPAFKRSCIETLNTEWTTLLHQETEMVDKSKCISEHHQQLLQQHLNWVNNVCTY